MKRTLVLILVFILLLGVFALSGCGCDCDCEYYDRLSVVSYNFLQSCDLTYIPVVEDYDAITFELLSDKTAGRNGYIIIRYSLGEPAHPFKDLGFARFKINIYDDGIQVGLV